MKLIAVYGTLRKGGYNHKKQLPLYEPLGTVTVKGFDMYDLGSYPAIVKGKGTVLFEIFEVGDKVAKDVDRMELDAGYGREVMGTEWGDATFYVMTKRQFNGNAPTVKSGDWIEYEKARPQSRYTYLELVNPSGVAYYTIQPGEVVDFTNNPF